MLSSEKASNDHAEDMPTSPNTTAGSRPGNTDRRSNARIAAAIANRDRRETPFSVSIQFRPDTIDYPPYTAFAKLA
jgi:hypothetical protein